MSAPTPGSSGNPSQGFYPDPSIPGYIRYWDGTAWVPGTSRPEPRDGEPMPAPPPGVAAPAGGFVGTAPTGPDTGADPGGGAAAPSTADPSAADPSATATDDSAPSTPPTAERAPGDPGGADPGDPSPGPGAPALPPAGAGGAPGTDLVRRPAATPEVRGGGATEPHQGGAPNVPTPPDQQPELTDWDDPGRLHGLAPGAASGWGSAPSGPGTTPDPVPAARTTPDETPQATWRPAEGSGPVADPRQGAVPEGRPQVTGPAAPAGALPPGSTSPAPGGPPAPPASGTAEPGTMAIRLPPAGSPDLPRPASGDTGTPTSSAPPTPPDAGAVAPPAAPTPAPVPPHQAPPAPGPGGAPAAPPAAPPVHDRTVGLRMPRQGPAGALVPPPGAGPAAADQPPAWPARPPEQGAPQPPGAATPPGGGPTPWRPPASDPFQQAAQAVSHPAGLGRRLIARLVDSVVLLGGTGAVAAVCVGPYLDHLRDKVEAVEEAGVTRTVWLVDGTTWVYLAAVLGTFLLLGLVAEVLPTGLKGRTLGKKLCGLTVLHVEQQEPPGFLAALRRWLVYSVLGVLAVGVVNVLWCLFDRPWRQCWHDKVARTFVTADSREVRL